MFGRRLNFLIKVCPANSPGPNPVDYRIGGNCRSVSTATGFVTRISWSHAWSKSGSNSSSRSLTKWYNSGVSIFEHAFKHAGDISNKNFRQAYCSTFHHCVQAHQSCKCGELSASSLQNVPTRMHTWMDVQTKLKYESSYHSDGAGGSKMDTIWLLTMWNSQTEGIYHVKQSNWRYHH